MCSEWESLRWRFEADETKRSHEIWSKVISRVMELTLNQRIKGGNIKAEGWNSLVETSWKRRVKLGLEEERARINEVDLLGKEIWAEFQYAEHILKAKRTEWSDLKSWRIDT